MLNRSTLKVCAPVDPGVAMAAMATTAHSSLLVMTPSMVVQQVPEFVPHASSREAERGALLHLDRDLVHRERFGGAAALRAGGLECLQGVHALDHLAEDAVLAIEPRRGEEGEEELAAVGARAGVGHRELAALVVLHVRRELARELIAGAAG